MAEMPDYNLTNSSDKQAFQRFMVELMRNEINSYTKQTQNSNPNPSASLETGVLPSGIIVPFAGGPGVTPNPGILQDVPDGWLLCAGDAVSRNSYSGLFAAVGTTYGVGDGSTTFNVPNLKGRIIVGAGTGAQQGVAGSGVITGGTALTARTIGAFFGDERLQGHTHTFNGTTGDDSPDHSHNYNAQQPVGTNAGGGIGQVGTNTGAYTAGANVKHQHGFSGTTNEHNQTPVGLQQNLQPSVVLNYIIKV